MKIFLSFILSLAFSMSVSAQVINDCLPFYVYGTLIYADSDDDSPMNFHRGFLTLASGAEHHGLIQLNKEKVYIIEDTIVEEINRDSIIYVRLNDFDPLLRTGKYYTEFIKVPAFGAELYRRLTYGDIEIYDRSYLVNERPGEVNNNNLLIWTDSGFEKLIDWWVINERKSLAESLSQTKGLSLDHKEFKDVREMLFVINRKY